jgi:hypothetical protein
VAVDEAENVCAARYVRGLVQIGIQLGSPAATANSGGLSSKTRRISELMVHPGSARLRHWPTIHK